MRTLICRHARAKVWRLIAVSSDDYAATYQHRYTGQVVVVHKGMW